MLELVARGCNPNAGDGMGWSYVTVRALVDPLPSRCRVGNGPRGLVRNRDGDGLRLRRCVHHAAEYGRVEVIQALQDLMGMDLDIDAPDNYGWCVAAAVPASRCLALELLTTRCDLSHAIPLQDAAVQRRVQWQA